MRVRRRRQPARRQPGRQRRQAPATSPCRLRRRRRNPDSRHPLARLPGRGRPASRARLHRHRRPRLPGCRRVSFPERTQEKHVRHLVRPQRRPRVGGRRTRGRPRDRPGRPLRRSASVQLRGDRAPPGHPAGGHRGRAGHRQWPSSRLRPGARLDRRRGALHRGKRAVDAERPPAPERHPWAIRRADRRLVSTLNQNWTYMDFYPQLQQATAAERAALLSTPLITAAMAGQVNRQHYIDFLTRAFHHVKHTVPLLMACGARLTDRQEWLRSAVAHYVEEELGNHEWILNDIAAAGGDAAAVRVSQPDFDTDAMVAFAYDTVMRRNPVGLFGMVYVLEGTSVSLASNAARALQKALDLPPTAFTYLSSHGALDVEHIGDFEQLVNRLDTPDDRESVVRNARIFFRLYGNVLRSINTQENT